MQAQAQTHAQLSFYPGKCYVQPCTSVQWLFRALILALQAYSDAPEATFPRRCGAFGGLWGWLWGFLLAWSGHGPSPCSSPGPTLGFGFGYSLGLDPGTAWRCTL